ncbi:hypothetical protein ACQ4M4_08180 [Leptolyngbya sp. AN02str]|uniref:slr1601 family putative cell division protein n=1 Tax=Leptolyngbya sp. AN02str TaxID=3423363 RepID=UPI003D311D05
MSAIQRYQTSVGLAEPAQPPSVRVRRRRVPKKQHHRAIAIEAGVKLAVNSLFALVAASTIIRLAPDMRSHQKQLKVIHQEVELMEARVDGLQTNFKRHFDPQQSYRVMQEQSSRIAPNQVQIIWVDSNTQQATIQPPTQNQ